MKRKTYQKPRAGKITFDYKVIASSSEEKPGPFVPGEEDDWIDEDDDEEDW